MPKQQVYHIRPLGWEGGADEERYKFCALDYPIPSLYSNYTLFFRLDHTGKSKAVEALQHGLSRTLSQVRHLCGNIERDSDRDYSFVRRKASAVGLHVQWFDAPDDADKYPSLDDMEQKHFCIRGLGDPRDPWIIPDLRSGTDNPAARLDARPRVLALKASFVRGGGLVLVTHMHHAANDAQGWVGFALQLAENCHAFVTGGPYPEWDPACLDVSRFSVPPLPESGEGVDRQQLARVDLSMPRPRRGRGRHQSLLFHLPKAKAAQLKALAQPSSSSSSFISTYDAFIAILHRTVTRLRQPCRSPATTPSTTSVPTTFQVIFHDP
jgi:hypothetical protein